MEEDGETLQRERKLFVHKSNLPTTNAISHRQMDGQTDGQSDDGHVIARDGHVIAANDCEMWANIWLCY